MAWHVEYHSTESSDHSPCVPRQNHPQSVHQATEKKLAEKRGGAAECVVLDELEECIGDQTDVEGIVESHELEELIRRFVRKLPERDGNLFVRRYFFTDSVASISERYRIRENHVMVILSRTRKKLKKELMKEGFICE